MFTFSNFHELFTGNTGGRGRERERKKNHKEQALVCLNVLIQI